MKEKISIVKLGGTSFFFDTRNYYQQLQQFSCVIFIYSLLNFTRRRRRRVLRSTNETLSSRYFEAIVINNVPHPLLLFARSSR